VSAGVDCGDAALRQRLVQLLVEVAPDVEPASLEPAREFRDQFEFDSMDLFNFAARVHRAFGFDIPEKDYRELGALARCEAYVRRRLAPVPAPPAAPGARTP
jgi:acyl carrier protein